MAAMATNPTAGYNAHVEAFRAEEYPMLHGELAHILMRDPLSVAHQTQDLSISTMPGQRRTPSR